MSRTTRIEGTSLSFSRYAGPQGRAMIQVNDSSGDQFVCVTVEGAEALARAILDELGLDHLARSLDLDRVLTLGTEPAAQSASPPGVADLMELMKGAAGQLVSSNPLEEAWLIQVMNTAAHLYTARLMLALGAAGEPVRGPRPVPSGVMAALYSADELAALSAMEPDDDETVWLQCVRDAFKLMAVVRAGPIGVLDNSQATRALRLLRSMAHREEQDSARMSFNREMSDGDLVRVLRDYLDTALAPGSHWPPSV